MKWEEDMQRLWSAATAKIGWGIWRTTHTGPDPVVVPTAHGQPVTLSVPGLHAVTTLDGRLVALTPTKVVADLLVTVPDLLDPSLRPEGSTQRIGTATPAGAHEAGWRDGFAVGQAEAYEEARDVIPELLDRLDKVSDPTEWSAEIAAARVALIEATAIWPTHEGQGDEDDVNEARPGG